MEGVLVTVKLIVYGSAVINAAWPAYKAATRLHDMAQCYRAYSRSRRERREGDHRDLWVWLDCDDLKGDQ